MWQSLNGRLPVGKSLSPGGGIRLPLEGIGIQVTKGDDKFDLVCPRTPPVDDQPDHKDTAARRAAPKSPLDRRAGDE